MANLVDKDFWQGRRVFVSGHTGFKGSWLCLLLDRLGARVTGYALDPPTTPALFTMAHIPSTLEADIRADIRDRDRLRAVLAAAEPAIVLHLAAQPLVRAAYADPVKTYAENVMGTVHLLDAVRYAPSVQAVVVVTTDKCYENREWDWGYRESDRLGGHDPYSSSKAAAELATQCFRDSFFSPGGQAALVATARAGNVIGGGDWAADRLIPDAVRAMSAETGLEIRYPGATRPWQHVLDPLRGYLMLAQRLARGTGFAQSWNFGPDVSSERSVAEVLQALASHWGERLRWTCAPGPQLHEAGNLKLDSARARKRLGWQPLLDFNAAIALTAAWYDASRLNQDMRETTSQQITHFLQMEPACQTT